MNAFNSSNTYKFTKPYSKTNCKYMCMLKALVDNPHGLTKAETYAISHKMDHIPNDGWGSNTWSAMRHYGLADFKRVGRLVKWFVTSLGKAFYYKSMVNKDLLVA